MAAKVGLSAPWVTFYRKIQCLFKDDPDIHVVYDEDNVEVKMYVDNEAKADAISKLIPVEKAFGNVVLKITIIPANHPLNKMRLFQEAFAGNPALSYTETVDGIFSNSINYIVFKNKVVQFFNDDISDINGLCSTLYQDIAKEVFGSEEGFFFCTDLPKAIEEQVPPADPGPEEPEPEPEPEVVPEIEPIPEEPVETVQE